jgi:tetratricopeptide (TPR) repeat protein
MHKAISGAAAAIVCALEAIPAAALAADTLAYGPVPAWVVPQQAPAAESGQSGAPIRILLTDMQLNFAPTISESYTDNVVLIQTPQGLANAGTISLSWRPETDQVTVHKLRILRADKEIDVLGSGQNFSILRREEQLEYAALSGVLTAVLQPEGLRVGDRVELAYTLKRTDALLGGVPENLILTNPAIPIARTHLRARWAADYKMTWRASTFLDGLKESRIGAAIEVSTTRDNDEPLVQPAWAPARFAAVRSLQFTGYKSWSEVSRLLFPMFDRASKLSPTSALRAEVARIRAATPDRRGRAEAALRLVQDQIRYVYLGMNDARIVPADVETTWSRRYGDCKAKTALLLALLRELDVEAQPVVVNTVAGDALPTRLPMIGVFNHVLVLATIAGKAYWLDGTRSGDRRLDDLLVPNYRWGLPLTAAGTELLRIEAVPLNTPMSETTITVDASAGATAPASFQVETVLRAHAATAVQQAISRLTDSQRDAALRAYWTRQEYWSGNWEDVTLQTVTVDFDDASGNLRLSMKGHGKMNWQGDQHLLESLGIGATVDYTREPGLNDDAPYLTTFPVYTRVIERIKLPHDGAGYSTVGKDVDQTIAGMNYRRRARLDKGELSAEASVRSVEAEFPASEARAAQSALRRLWEDPLYAKLPADRVEESNDLDVLADRQFSLEVANPIETLNADINRGNMLINRREYDHAIDAFNEAIAIDAKADMALADRGMAYVWKADDDRARKDFDAALALNPRNPVVFRGRGVIALRAGNASEAISSFTRSLELEPDNVLALGYRASAYVRTGQDDQALADGAEVIRLQPTNVDTYMSRASIFIKRGQTDKAIAEAASLTSANPNNSIAYISAGRIYATFKMKVEAMQAFDRAVQIGPDETTYLTRASYRLKTDIAGRRADVDAALKLNDHSMRALMMKAAIQTDAGDYTGAISTYNVALLLGGNDSELLTGRGIVYVKNNQEVLAERDFAAARAKAVDARALNHMCWAMATSAVSLTEALNICEAAVAKAPDYAPSMDSRAFTLLRLGRYDEAIVAYDSALKLAPTSIASMYGRGVAKRHRGDIEAGDADIKAALAASPLVAEMFAGYGVNP